MLFSLDWLRAYVDLPESPEEIAQRLPFAGFSVEGVVEGRDDREGDVVLDIDITTNRPDAMNHLGLARELAVLYGRPLRPPEPALREAAESISGVARVELPAEGVD